MTMDDETKESGALASRLVAKMLHDKGAIEDPEDPALLAALEGMTAEQLAQAKEICESAEGADPHMVALILAALRGS